MGGGSSISAWAGVFENAGEASLEDIPGGPRPTEPVSRRLRKPFETFSSHQSLFILPDFVTIKLPESGTLSKPLFYLGFSLLYG
ncbi:MAG: hypothetical protein COV67_13080 [Nitrospinae bacterium CG11_big_fil_rev_8_21_14_0_20_56_8]|nr:MAG: hypothetical protein COV67_13080 [Nitrospinae bacterium CG11_big_fil_rev_8_21_14_0_20_56_8]